MLSSLAVAIGMSGGFAIGTGGGFEIGISGGFHRNTQTDTGPGIAPELQDRIFEKFSQGNARVSYQHGGTGLGLSLSRSLATLLGGTLSVQSRPGEGARFTLALPR